MGEVQWDGGVMQDGKRLRMIELLKKGDFDKIKEIMEDSEDDMIETVSDYEIEKIKNKANVFRRRNSL